MSAPSLARTHSLASPHHLSTLRQRLGVVAVALGIDDVPQNESPELACSQLYGRLVDRVCSQSGSEALWLLMTALSAALPDPDDVIAALRARDVSRPSDFAAWLLEAGYSSAVDRGAMDLEMDVVTDGVVVDVDFSAQNELHTGIQRVVRETVPRWVREHELTLVAWTEAGGVMRQLSPAERERVLRWNERRPARADSAPSATHPPRLVVPWRCSVLLLETPPPEHCPPLAAVSLYSGNTVGVLGYDCIPAISPELIHEGLPDRFMRYLQVVKHADRVAGISGAATREFRGFVDMLVAQGLTGPAVVEVSLPVQVPPGDPAPVAGPPLVVTIGSFEPRKNQLAVLHAAEQLWREGLEFQLQFIGGGGWATEFDRMMTRLRSAGRPVSRRTAITDTELWGAIRSARFTVFVSLHEGFGLPVAESVACGTPSLTSDYGSTREIADGGGALVVDPTDDVAIADQMRRLLTDDDLVAELREQALRRPQRTWDDYARELWRELVPHDRATAPAGRTPR